MSGTPTTNPAPNQLPRGGTRADGTVLGEQELVSSCILLLVAGNETTANLIANPVLSLDVHRSLVPSAIEETLRYRSPIRKINRFSTAETELGGVRTPAGPRMVVAHLGSADRDEARFEGPEEFGIDREPDRHVAFGQGVRFCLGAPLGRHEAKGALGVPLERLPNLRVVPDDRLQPIPSNGFHGVPAVPKPASGAHVGTQDKDADHIAPRSTGAEH